MANDAIRHRPVKSWQKIDITLDSRLADAVAAFITDLTGTGVEMSTAAKKSRVPESTANFEKITGYLSLAGGEGGQRTASDKIEELRSFIARLSHIFPDCSMPHVLIETVTEEDWGEKWKKFFTSFHITPSLVIKPSWEEAKAQDSEEKKGIKIIEMDPGLAFGTGHHASTQLALLLLEELFHQPGVKPEKVLDVGTGSGILAMACAKFGAREILAVDNDPDAVAAAKRNIAINSLEDRVAVNAGDVVFLEQNFDIVVANITHDILAALAQSLAKSVKPEGFLVISGILKGEQEHSMRNKYTRLGLDFIKSLVRDEWTALVFTRKGGRS